MIIRCGDYELTKPILRGDKAGLRASLWEATDGGLFLFARTWPRTGALRDLAGLWNLETRTLLRLNGYPRSEEHFVRLRDLGVDEERYYVVLDAGDRFPLSVLALDSRRSGSIRALRTPAGRRNLWRGVRTIATGLGILHAEGTLHRALGPDSIFADDRSEGDFRLSGFEWSLRVAAPAAGAGTATGQTKRLRAPELDRTDGGYGFATDWFDLGILVAELLGFDVSRKGRRPLDRLRTQIETSNHLNAKERFVLMGLLEPTPELRLAQTSEVLPRLADASAAVSHRSSQPDKPLIIGFALGASSGVSRAINEITQGREAIRLDDVPAQLAFIEQDLKAATHVSIRAHDGLRYVVNGARIQYSVQQWRRPEPTWDVGFCTKVELAPPESLDQLVPLDGRHIEPRAAPELARTLLKARQRAAAWDVVLPPDTRVEALSEQQRRILDFFVLTNQLDALLSAARIWPVKVVDVYERNDGFEIEVTPAPEEARDSLAISLKLSQTATQMRDGLFSLKPSGDELKFEIDEEGLLVRREGPRRAAWRYERAYHHSAGDRYVFWTDEVAARPPLHGAKAYVMPAGLGGTVAQLKRRQRAIENMRQHAGLLSAIADPDASRRDTSDKPRQSEILEGLDSSKRQALDAIWGTQPLFTLQGPPGTGKTRLLETGIVTLLEEDPTRQILVTAQSHEAVKNVERKLLKRLAEQTNPSERLIIRLDDDKDDQHVTKVATDLRASLAKSDLANKLPDGLRRRLVAEAGLDVTTREARSFEVLVRDSANIVLATSNSGDLARMEGNRTRFDWSIVEEAGKAHGFDLALALQSSPRVVLIGDQAQLPPFNYEALYALFNEPDRILEAIKLGGGFAPSLVDRTFSVLTEDDRQRFKQDAPLWRDMVLFFGDLFSRCLLSERRNVKMAYRLNEQHRMHPVICELVSDGFYKGDLETHEDARARFAKEPVPFTLRENSWLPDEPIVFVDLPWVQEDKSAVGEHGGRISGGSYRNDAEVEAAIAVLEQLRPVSGEACEVQLLAPYRGQVRALAGAAATALDEGRLDALKTATPPFAGKALGATVDEFQGNEADIVVVSLVRNNDESVGKGLGFLDQRRLNVLLSRARRKLVLVGSWRFLESRIPTGTRLSEDDPLVHIQTLMSWLEANTVPGRVARVDYAALKRDAS